jgi:hypothetical protein
MTRSTTETTLFWDYYRRRDDENELDGAPRHNQPRQPAPGLQDPTPDMVNHPAHYTSHPSGVEAIDVTEHFNFNLGNCIKYVWRADHKNDALEDLRKARFYLDREIARREGTKPCD